MKAFLLSLVLCLSAGPVMAEEWAFLGEGIEGETIFFDVSSFRFDEKKISVLVKSNLFVFRGSEYSLLYNFTCDSTSSDYNQFTTIGLDISTEEIMPGTLPEQMRDGACKLHFNILNDSEEFNFSRFQDVASETGNFWEGLEAGLELTSTSQRYPEICSRWPNDLRCIE